MLKTWNLVKIFIIVRLINFMSKFKPRRSSIDFFECLFFVKEAQQKHQNCRKWIRKRWGFSRKSWSVWTWIRQVARRIHFFEGLESLIKSILCLITIQVSQSIYSKIQLHFDCCARGLKIIFCQSLSLCNWEKMIENSLAEKNWTSKNSYNRNRAAI